MANGHHDETEKLPSFPRDIVEVKQVLLPASS